MKQNADGESLTLYSLRHLYAVQMLRPLSVASPRRCIALLEAKTPLRPTEIQSKRRV